MTDTGDSEEVEEYMQKYGPRKMTVGDVLSASGVAAEGLAAVVPEGDADGEDAAETEVVVEEEEEKCCKKGDRTPPFKLLAETADQS